MSKKTDRRLAAQESQIVESQKAVEQIASAYTLLQRQVEDLNYIDLSGYGIENQDDVLPNAKRVEVILRLRRLRHENPIGKQAVKLARRFVFGKGVGYLVKNETSKGYIDEFWNDPVNQTLLTGRKALQLRFDEKLTDGEWFLVMFKSDVAPYVRLGRIPMTEITETLYDPDNDEMPVWYVRRFKTRKYDPKLNGGAGGWDIAATEPTVRYYRDYRITDDMLADIESRGLVIPQEKQGEGVVMHSMINEVRLKIGWRGISELFASREWFRVFKEFMEDRGAINAAANALSFKRKIKGGPATVASFSNRLGGVKVQPEAGSTLDGAAFARLTRPMAGAVYNENEGVDLQGQRVDTGAMHAERDARMLLMAGGTGTNTSIVYFGEGSAALASAQVMELPMVKGYEDYQQESIDELREIINYVLEAAYGRETQEDEEEIAFIFPQIISQDVVKWITAFAQWSQQIAPGNNVVRRAAIRGGMAALNVPNADMLMADIDTEEKRLQAEKAVKDQMALDAQKAAADAAAKGLVPGAPNQPGVPGSPVAPGGKPPIGQKAGGGPQPSGLPPDVIRAQAGKPPKEKNVGPRSKRQ